MQESYSQQALQSLCSKAPLLSVWRSYRLQKDSSWTGRWWQDGLMGFHPHLADTHSGGMSMGSQREWCWLIYSTQSTKGNVIMGAGFICGHWPTDVLRESTELYLETKSSEYF